HDIATSPLQRVDPARGFVENEKIGLFPGDGMGDAYWESATEDPVVFRDLKCLPEPSLLEESSNDASLHSHRLGSNSPVRCRGTGLSRGEVTTFRREAARRRDREGAALAAEAAATR